MRRGHKLSNLDYLGEGYVTYDVVSSYTIHWSHRWRARPDHSYTERIRRGPVWTTEIGLGALPTIQLHSHRFRNMSNVPTYTRLNSRPHVRIYIHRRHDAQITTNNTRTALCRVALLRASDDQHGRMRARLSEGRAAARTTRPRTLRARDNRQPLHRQQPRAWACLCIRVRWARRHAASDHLRSDRRSVVPAYTRAPARETPRPRAIDNLSTTSNLVHGACSLVSEGDGHDATPLPMNVAPQRSP